MFFTAAQIRHVDNHTFCMVPSGQSDGDDSVWLTSVEVVLDMNIITCVQPFANSNNILQVQFDVAVNGGALHVAMTGHSMSCGEPYMLVYFEMSSADNTDSAIKRQCVLSSNTAVNTDLMKCTFMCTGLTSCTTAHVTAVLEAPTWAPDSHWTSQWCEINFPTSECHLSTLTAERIP